MSRHCYYGSGNLHVSDTEGVKLLVKQISDEQDDFEMAHDDEDDLDYYVTEVTLHPEGDNEVD